MGTGQGLGVEVRLELESGLGRALAVTALTRRRHFWLLVRQSHLYQVGLLIVGLAVALALLGPVVAPHSTANASCQAYAPPSWSHPFGCDSSGLDVFSRTIVAPRVDVTIALGATLLSLIVGSLIGLCASYSRGWIGELVMRASDTIQAVPLLVLAIIFVVLAGRSDLIIVGVIALLNVPIYLRLIRSQVLSLRERTFIEAARANGARPLSVAVRHVLPNAMTPGFAQAPITFGFAVLVIAGLSFIGAGIQPPAAEWGAMISAGRGDLQLGLWWTSVFPGAGLSVTVFGFAVLGDALRTVLLRKEA
jgi:peptide/nickel transport system permease protein